MEYYVAEDRRPLDKCLADVRSCDLYLLVVARRYGHVPPGYEQSITELEYREAVRSGKKCLIFLLADDAPWPGNLWEIEKIGQVQAWRQELEGSGRIVAYFARPDDLGRQVAEAVIQWQHTAGEVPSERVDWTAYRAALEDRYRWVRLEVIAGRGRDDNERVPLLDAFVPQPASRGLPRHEVIDREPGDGMRESSTAVIGRDRRQVIVGGPGSGKSTLLQYMTVALTSGNVDQTRTAQLSLGILPFLIDLRTYTLSAADSFVAFIVEEMRKQYVRLDKESVEAILDAENGAMVLFDGLDEVFEHGARRRTTEELSAFARRYRQAHIVVTSRIVGYVGQHDEEMRRGGFEHYTLHDFGLAEIRRFVPTWYTFARPRDESRNAAALVAQIEDNPSLLDLAGNPLLLTMMAIIHRQEPLPEKRWLLYERCTQVLLEDWDVKRKNLETKQLLPLPFPVTKDHKARILRRVSMMMLSQRQDSRELNALGLEPLLEIISTYLEQEFHRPPGEAQAFAAEILNHVRERTYVLAEIGDGIFGFVHRTFMEYFAAADLKAEFGRRKADFEWLAEVFEQNWQRDEWRDPPAAGRHAHRSAEQLRGGRSDRTRPAIGCARPALPPGLRRPLSR